MNTPHPAKDADQRTRHNQITRLVGQLTLGLAILCVSGGTALAKGGATDNACTQTTKAAFTACLHDVEDNFWIAIGNCSNVADSTVRAACKRDAKTTQHDERATCDEQRGARQEACQAIGEAPYDPQIDPAQFIDPAQIGNSVAPNPYFPLIAGRTWIYKGGTETDTVTVTQDTRTILGVTCAAVHDVVVDSGQVTEDTVDWYAQDLAGNVWYFGEIAQQLEDGVLVDIEGSWTSGKDSAKPGLIMKAHPAVGETYRQEFSLATAEDMAQVLSLTGSATVPAATCNGNCLITRDFTPIEPDTEEQKYYALVVGLILEVDPATGVRMELVEVKN